MPLKVKGPRILVRQDRLEEKDPTFASAKKAGIIIEDHFKEKRLEQNAVDEGTVVDIGEGCWNPPVGNGDPWCKIGDRVVFAKYAGSVRREGSDFYILLNDEDILGVITDE